MGQMAEVWSRSKIRREKAKVGSNRQKAKAGSKKLLQRIRIIIYTRVTLKKKLTLTVQEDVIKYAKRKAKRRGISVSQMF